MQYTTNLNLTKPELTDNVVIADLNGNMDILDNAIYTHETDGTKHISAAERTKLSDIQPGAQVNVVTKVAGRIGDIALTKSDVGLINVDNIKQASKAEHDQLVQTVTTNEETVAAHKEEYTSFKDDNATQIKIKQNISILAAGWTLNSSTQLQEYTITDTDITASTVVDVNITVADLEKASDLLSANESFNGHVKLYAKSPPTENISCDIKLIRQVF